jgi:hypothetical protein
MGVLTIDSRLDDDLAPAGFDFFYSMGMSLLNPDRGSTANTGNNSAKSPCTWKESTKVYAVDPPFGISFRLPR